MANVDAVGNWAPQKTSGIALSSICDAACVPVGNMVYAFGGFHLINSTVNNDVYALNTETLVWSTVDDIRGEPPCARYGHSMTLWGQHLIVFGGSDAGDNDLDDIHFLNLTTMTWEIMKVHGTKPKPRRNHSSTIHNHKLYIHGGEMNYDEFFLDDLNVLDLQTLTWSGPIKIGHRHSHFSFVYRNCFYVYGGMLTEDKFENCDDLIAVDLEDYETSTLVINSRQSPPQIGRRFAQICGNKLVVVNSLFSPRVETLKDQTRNIPTGVWSLNLHTFKWTRHDSGLTCLDKGSWHYFAMAPNDTRLLLLGVSNTENEGYQDHVDDYLGWMLKINVGSFGIMSIPSTSMPADFASIFENSNKPDVSSTNDSTDFVIYAGDDKRPIRVHRLILNVRWPHFAAIGRSGMSESVNNSLELPETREAILGFTRYLYTDSLDAVSDSILADLMVMGNIYCLERLQRLACVLLHERLSIENASKTFLRASRAGETGLKERSMAMILERFGEVTRTQDFRSLSREELDELLESIPLHAGMRITREPSPKKRPFAMLEADLEGDGEHDAEMDGEVDGGDLEAEPNPDSDAEFGE
ncbi:hypothetical protein HDU97_006789 [Phlyctochytrium planicorne]|nr:hypothetical protein HDU97_006789 [Phlyctochytrium planicorne]